MAAMVPGSSKMAVSGPVFDANGSVVSRNHTTGGGRSVELPEVALAQLARKRHARASSP
jgi:hypothetical protein